MVPGTFSFDQWLLSLEVAAGQTELRHRLQLIAAKAQEAFGAMIWFAEIFGPRWSYIAGTRSIALDSGNIRKIPLGEGLGLVFTTWGTMTTSQQTALIGLIKRQIKPWIYGKHKEPSLMP
jgi:hypothetical protein